MTEQPPEQIGRFRIVDVLGEGAMGVVYRAQDTVLDRPVAVKVMADAIAREPDLRERFLREARAAGGLQHPNVVTIYDFGEADGFLYIAMELVPGIDLSHVLTHGVPLPLDTKLAVVAGLLTGLAYAHRRGVVHRDVKPANVRVTEDGAVKIMDFGIAHVASSELTRTGMTMGTPSYMAPEQVEGTPVTPATDIFATGVVLYELLAGAKPFVGPTLHSILYKIVSEEPIDVFTGVAGIPPSLPPIVFRALAKNPAERYGDALTMADDLNRVRAELSQNAGTAGIVAAVASATSAVSPLRTRAGAPRGGVPAGAVGVISFPPVTGIGSLGAASFPPGTFGSANSSGTGGSPAGERSRTHAPAPDRAPTTTARRAPMLLGGSALLVAAAVGLWTVMRRPEGAIATSVAPAAERGAAPETPLARSTTPIAASMTNGGDVPPAPLAGRTSSSASGSARSPAVTAPSPTTGAVAPRSSAAASVPARETATVAGVTPPAAAAIAAPPNASPRTPAPLPVSAAPPLVTPPVAAPTTAPAPSAAGVREALDAYARALESRDLAAVRRVYPAITDRQESGWRALFDATRSLDVTLAVSDVSVSGTTATASVSGQSAFVMSDGHRQTQPLAFRATLRHDAAGWKLAAVQ